MSGHVFISYSRADRAYVEKLATFLEAAGIRCWYDHELAAGDRWGHVIRAEIDRCAAFVVVMTPAAAESKWVSRELARADGRKPIFPLLLAGEPFFELSEVQFENVTGERLPGASIVNRLRSLVTVDSAPTSRYNSADGWGRATALVARIENLRPLPAGYPQPPRKAKDTPAPQRPGQTSRHAIGSPARTRPPALCGGSQLWC